MARLRYSLDESRAEAIRRAEALVASRENGAQWRFLTASPNTSVAPSKASKHPLAWVVMFSWVPPDGIEIDGCELRVAVNLETGTVGNDPM